MINLTSIFIFLLIFKAICSKEFNVQSNPCPDKFQYFHDSDGCYGIITISGRKEGPTEVQVTLAFHEEQKHDYGINIDFLKSFEETKQDVMSNLGLKLKIPFPNVYYWPIVTDISVNNHSICSGQKVNMYKVTYTQPFTYPKGPKPSKSMPISPCPKVLQYKSENGNNYGVITITGPREGKTSLKTTIFIYEALDNNNFGSLEFLKSYDETLADAKTTNGIQYKLNLLKFKYWPIIRNITLNNVNICLGPEVTELASWTHSHEFDYIKLTNTRTQYVSPCSVTLTTSKPKSVKKEEKFPQNKNWLGSFRMKRYQSSCGKTDFIPNPKINPVQLIIGGKTVAVGEYPWMVAMFEYQRGKYVFFCGANLVTNQHVITAAHCIKSKTSIQLRFGIYDLVDIGVVRSAKDRITHPEYKENRPHSDIGIVSFDPVTFTDKIRPICNWHFDTKFDLFSIKGRVSGWGQANDMEPGFNEKPLQTPVSIVSLNECRKSHELLQKLVTDQTFCAGGNVSGPCFGDSGGGFYGNFGNRWYLIGIISTSIGTKLSCYVDKYSIFVNVAHYSEWIKGVLS